VPDQKFRAPVQMPEKTQSIPGDAKAGFRRTALAGGKEHCVALLVKAGHIVSVTPGAPRQLPGLGALPAPFSALPPLLQDALRQVEETGRPVIQSESHPEIAGGAIFHLYAVPTLDEQHTPLVALFLVEASTSSRADHSMLRLERQARAGQLATGMAHEVKNALVAIHTFVDLLLEKNPDTELAGIVQREIQRVELLVTRMLKFGSAAASQIRPLRLHEAIEHALQLVRPRLNERQIRLDQRLEAGTDLITGDSDQLEQAFLNLLLNAIEAIGTDGTLTVRTNLAAASELPDELVSANPTKFVRVSIVDTGAGVAEENLNRLFEPFFTTKPEGTGLGLAITLKIIEAHHGAITVLSQTGAGTTFDVFLPLTENAP
jgi:signal transduction histidine kinase